MILALSGCNKPHEKNEDKIPTNFARESLPVEHLVAYTCLNFEENTAKLPENEEKNWQLFRQKMLMSQQEKIQWATKGLSILVMQQDNVKANKKIYELRKKLIINSFPNLKTIQESVYTADKSSCNAVVAVYTGVSNLDEKAYENICYPNKWMYQDRLQCNAKYQCNCTSYLDTNEEIRKYNQSLFSKLDDEIFKFTYAQRNL